MDFETYVEGLSFDPSKYKALKPTEKIRIAGADGNRVLVRGELQGKLDIQFSPKAKDSTVFLCGPMSGSVRIRVEGSRSIVYVGADCRVNNLQLNSQQNDDRIVVGNGVSCTGTSAVSSGMNAGSATPYVVVGDDAMISHGVTIRNTDAHPIIAIETNAQLNSPRRHVIIEPHVWLGQDCSILKNTTVGACSIVALGAVVVKDVPRFAVASGIPATSTPRAGAVWSRGMAPRFVEKAQHYAKEWS